MSSYRIGMFLLRSHATCRGLRTQTWRDVISWLELRVARDHVMDREGSRWQRDPGRSTGLYNRGFALIVFELHAQLNWLFPQSSHRIIIHWYCLSLLSVYVKSSYRTPRDYITFYYCQSWHSIRSWQFLTRNRFIC